MALGATINFCGNCFWTLEVLPPPLPKGLHERLLFHFLVSQFSLAWVQLKCLGSSCKGAWKCAYCYGFLSSIHQVVGGVVVSITSFQAIDPGYIPGKCMPLGFPSASDSKESTCNAGDPSLIPGSGRSSGEGNGYPLQSSYLENSMGRGAWWAIVHGVTKTQT